ISVTWISKGARLHPSWNPMVGRKIPRSDINVLRKTIASIRKLPACPQNGRLEGAIVSVDPYSTLSTDLRENHCTNFGEGNTGRSWLPRSFPVSRFESA